MTSAPGEARAMSVPRTVLARMPKVELHLHLDLCLSLAAAQELEPELDEVTFAREFVAPPRVNGLAEFLRRTERHLDLLQTADGLRVLTRDVHRQLVDDGVVYAEVRFAPHQHRRRGLTVESAVAAVTGTIEDVAAGGPVAMRLLLCGLWSDPPEHTREILELVAASRGSLIVGMDVAGDETHPHRADHLAVLAEARRRAVPFTVHGGEGAGPENVRDLLDTLAPVRIGHGVRAIEDPRLVDDLAEAGTHLEMCPSCNVQLGVVDGLDDYPARRLVEAGVSVGLNTDQRTVTATTMTDEYARLAGADPYWTVERLHARSVAALEVAFVDEPTRRAVHDRLGGSDTPHISPVSPRPGRGAGRRT